MITKLCVIMPVEGPPETARVCYGVQMALRRLGNVVRLDEQPSALTGNVDISRARDRLARVALMDTNASHFLWWDEDVLPEDLEIINRLLETGHDCVGVPYRRKKDKEEYPYRLQGLDQHIERRVVDRGCIAVDWLAFGFMLTSRACLTKMWDAYLGSRWWFDLETQPDGSQTHHLSVGMFDLVYTPTIPGPDGRPWRTKLSEDYSFCSSYNEIGGQVHMFVGQGAPVGHIGSHVFRGTLEGLAGKRPEKAA